MAGPVGGEVAIYTEPVKVLDYRIGVNTKYKFMAEEFEETFDTALERTRWVYSRALGAPLVTGGELHIALHGSACHEFVLLRPEYIGPLDLSVAFTMTINLTFPTEDPIYDAVVTIGTIDTVYGTDGEPLRIIHHGSMHLGTNPDGSDIGQIEYTFPGTYPGVVGVNDMASHEYKVIYDPAAGDPLVVQVDGVEVYPAGETGVNARPYSLLFGMMQQDGDLTYADTRRENAVLTPSASVLILNGDPLDEPASTRTPYPIILVQDVLISADSYDTIVRPAWGDTAGTNINDSAEGTYFNYAAGSYVKIPKKYVASCNVNTGRAMQGSGDTFDVQLLARNSAEGADMVSMFNRSRFRNQAIFIDSRTGNEDLAAEEVVWAEWRRDMFGIIESVSFDGVYVTISGRDRISVILDTFFAVGFFAVSLGDDQDAPADGATSGLSLENIFSEIFHVCDAIYGDEIGDIEGFFRSIDIAPQMLSSGGGSLGGVIAEWAQRAAQEYRREYETNEEDSDKEFGLARTNLWTMDHRQPALPTQIEELIVWLFEGDDGVTGDADISSPGVSLVKDSRRAPGQAYYRNDGGFASYEPVNAAKLPFLSLFPVFAYPPTANSLQDSYGPFMGAVAEANTITLQNAEGENVTGGIAMHRWRMENTQHKTISFRCIGHNWLQPGMVVIIQDPDGSSIVLTDIWVVDNVQKNISGGSMRVTVQASTADWLSAARQAYADGSAW